MECLASIISVRAQFSLNDVKVKLCCIALACDTELKPIAEVPTREDLRDSPMVRSLLSASHLFTAQKSCSSHASSMRCWHLHQLLPKQLRRARLHLQRGFPPHNVC